MIPRPLVETPGLHRLPGLIRRVKRAKSLQIFGLPRSPSSFHNDERDARPAWDCSVAEVTILIYFVAAGDMLVSISWMPRNQLNLANGRKSLRGSSIAASPSADWPAAFMPRRRAPTLFAVRSIWRRVVTTPHGWQHPADAQVWLAAGDKDLRVEFDKFANRCRLRRESRGQFRPSRISPRSGEDIEMGRPEASADRSSGVIPLLNRTSVLILK